MSTAFWICGNLEERKLALDKIKSQFVGFESDTITDSDSISTAENKILSFSCFSEKRLIIINSIPSPDQGSSRQTVVNKLKKILEDLPDDLCLVFYGIDPSDEKAIFSQFEKIGKVLKFQLGLEMSNAIQWSRSKFLSYDKTISDEDLESFIKNCGYDKNIKIDGKTKSGGINIDILNIAIKKLCLYVGSRKKNITSDDISATLFESKEFIIWQLFNAFDSKDIIKCYEAVERIKLDNDRLIDAVETIFSMSLWRYKLLFHIKEEKSNRPNTNLFSYFISLPKISQTGSGLKMKMTLDKNDDGNNKSMYSQFVIENALKIVDNYSRKELRIIIETLEEGYKVVRDNYDSSLLLLLDSLIFSVCGTTDLDTLKLMRI